ncbi:hypothetical protein BO70DRAFT_340587 [Aspergillus heteromorphus CBS 117.55]|uniref:Nucleoside phosphorylase domain-containing protein n=1 Tax=Aspergillus heteromorphus CBS 117.55 TaxID=1448321 RepID=A0A317VMA8_9EURO|nr:uncharacterized protein BO70DRAFT_340587 [Aspergillus heteromorphus CBS 117.55]PWY75504.1 hypothetical protein BO70DRAFT_340587 [Aspergillus heteromorphus CBS 117.55]
MLFCYREITDSFRHRYLQNLHENRYKEEEDKNPDNHDRALLNQLIGDWLGGLEDPEGSGPEILSRPNQDEVKDSASRPPQSRYHDLILESSAYAWLVDQLRRELVLSPQEPNHPKTIREHLFKILPKSDTLSPKNTPRLFTLLLNIRWDVRKFIEEQGYRESPDDALASAITLTGSTEDAQALRCTDYMKQTWPGSGEHIIQLVKDLLLSNNSDQCKVRLNDRTEVAGVIHDKHIIIKATGLVHSLAEISEQFTWLAAALHTSPYSFGVASCNPSFFFHSSDPMPSFSAELPELPGPRCNVFGYIDCTVRPRALQGEAQQGKCWHGLFKNPIVVKGFPIPRRPEPNTGLELPLDILAGLTQTNRLGYFAERTVIKGFSTMLLATKRAPDILIWHLLLKRDGSRISYLESNKHDGGHFNNDVINSSRHIVGWCSEVRYYAGAADSSYDVAKSRLPKPHKGCVLEKEFIRSGHTIMGGLPALGRKDMPSYVSRFGYLPKLKWLSKKFVLLWDEDEKRGWLVNGTSALLHLLRQSLQHDAADIFKTEFLFHSDQIHESSHPYKVNSAIDVLLNSSNKKLKLYPEKDEFIRLEDRVEQIGESLEKIIDYQLLGIRGGTDFRDIPRNYLEGWDFDDIATDHDPSFPRVATLHPTAESWVDFVRSIQAVTLFGRGFGDILVPEGPELCNYWKRLPKGRYLIGASVADLQRVMLLGGDQTTNPIKLSDEIIWHSPYGAMDPCECTWNGSKCHSDLVQVLLPSSFGRKLPEMDPPRLEPEGAVIFGHNSSFKWTRDDRDFGDPEELQSPVQDSGLGQSLTSSRLSYPSRSTLSRQSSEFDSECRAHHIGSTALAEIRNPSIVPDAKSASPTCDNYTVGVVCALHRELLAVRAVFDSKHTNFPMPSGDTNHYALGRIKHHNVVAACLPSGQYGTNSAANVASHMVRSFPSLKFCLLVGIGGGVPSAENDIRLGDVVVSWPTDEYSGVIQYDLGKTLKDGEFRRVGFLNGSSSFLMTALSSLRSDPDISAETQLLAHVHQIEDRRPDYKSPGPEHDKLYESDCVSSPSPSLQTCTCPELPRPPRKDPYPRIHYGLIASGNQVIRDNVTRDRLARQHNVLCFEMEAAGIMNTVPCLVIRGICDYADSHKNNLWQGYAAATAAAYMKIFLSATRATDDGGLGEVRPAGAGAGVESRMKRAMSWTPSDDAQPLKKARR